MANLLLGAQFRIFAACSFVLCLLMFALGAITAARRASQKTYANSEDKKVSPEGSEFNQGNDPPEVTRVMRAHRNLIESLLPFSILGVIYVISGASLLGAEICFIGFTVVRVLHAIVYLKGLQPWRTMFFGFGLLAMMGMMVMSGIALFA